MSSGTYDDLKKPIRLSQQGIYRKPSDTSVSGAISFQLRNESDRKSQEALVRLCQTVYNADCFKHKWIVGFSYEFSRKTLPFLRLNIEDFKQLDLPLKGDESAFGDIEGDTKHFKNDRHHAILLAYADNVETFLQQREVLRGLIKDKLDGKVDTFETLGLLNPDMKILGGRFADGTNNAQDHLSMERHILKTRDNKVQGSTFMFTQVFDFDQSALGTLTDTEMENMIGRTIKHQAFVGSTDNSFSHVERIRSANAKTGLNFQMLRIPFLLLTDPEESAEPREMRSMEVVRHILETGDITTPFDPTGSRSLPNHESHLIERGLFFAGLCRSPARIKALLDVMSGKSDKSETSKQNSTDDHMYASSDRLLTYMNGTTGGYFWVPSAQVLAPGSIPKSLPDCDLHPIWDVEQRNEYMFFNMQQWSHIMSSGKYLEKARAAGKMTGDDTPSNRILHLCSSTFDQWRQRWVKPVPHVHIPHLETILIDNPTFLPADFVDLNGVRPDVSRAKVERADERNEKYRSFRDPIFAVPPMGQYIKDIPVVMRKGLAIREQLRLFTDKNRPEVGIALDTYRLEPGELIVGTLEEYSLGSGKLAMEYLCYGEERLRAKEATLSELSAMGHIVPDYGIILQKGLAAMIKDLGDRIEEAPEPKTNTKVHFWKGTKYALEGIDIYLENYADLAKQTRRQIETGEYKGTNTMSGMQSYITPDLFPTDFRELRRVLNLPIRFKTKRYHKHTVDVTCADAEVDMDYLWTPTSDAKQKNYEEIMNLKGLEAMLQSLRYNRPNTFIQAVQLFFVTHASLHLTADPVSAGRLDQLFQPFYEDDLDYYKNYVATKLTKMKPEQRDITIERAAIDYRRSAQDIIDALCLKWSEKINMNMTRIPDVTSFGTTAVMFGTGPFGSGDSNNQWFHQVSLGGMKESSIPEDGCNDVTMMFLRSMRRLPLIAPGISLRVNEQTPSEILEEAAKALLSGGAHPIVFHDRSVSNGLHDSLKEAYKNDDKKSRHFSPERLVAMSRQYACDGCYEPLLSGYSDFSFLFVPLLQALECALNQGATYITAGPEYLRGQVITWKSPMAKDIASFDHLLDLTIDFHLDHSLQEFFGIPLFKFGALADYCPSPLLSSLMYNSIERGKDLTQGGAMVHIVTPMFIGMSNFIDSLFAIKTMVYHPKLKVTTLSELTQALVSNWGERDETWKPFVSATRIRQTSDRFAHLRRLALSLPKFGGPDHVCDEYKQWINGSMKAALREELNEFGKAVAARVIKKAKQVAREVYSEQNMRTIQEKYGESDFPFQFTVTIGAGSFENYVGAATGTGASADGRLAGQPFASDCSPAASPIDLPPMSLSNPSQYRGIVDALQAYDHEAFRSGFANACELDINITEDTSLDSLREFLRKYATDVIRATSIVTFTIGDPDRYTEGITQPQQYELFRVRMGGWSNYYICQWLVHQKQHQRRPFFKI